MDKVLEVHAWRHDAHGFVAHDNATATIVAAFTGTDPFSLPDWIDDLDVVKADFPFPGCGGAAAGPCRVHRGFLEAYLQIREQVLDALSALRRLHAASPLLLTGHSLGGALATFAALDVIHLLNDSVPVLYTFGKPRVGNRAFQVRAHVLVCVCAAMDGWMDAMVGWMAWMDPSMAPAPPNSTTQPCTHAHTQEFVDASLAWAGASSLFRVGHHRDPVPHLPPQLLGFRHAGREVYYPGAVAEDGAYVVCEKVRGRSTKMACVVFDWMILGGRKCMACLP